LAADHSGFAGGCNLGAEWLFLPEALEAPDADLDNIVSFGVRVLEEEAAICELNQRGLHSLRHAAGVLMPEEYELHRFQQ
jgi:Rieske 2Fe-2S family protein